MKSLVSLLACIALSYPTSGQTETAPEQTIRRMMDCGCLEGHDQKILGGMGDGAAVLITKVVAGRSLTDTEMDSILLVLNISFAGTAQAASDRQPKTALFVLQYLDMITKNLDLKKRISETRKYVQDQSVKSRSL